jgi:hypothetical protein
VSDPFDKRCADRLADEVDVLIQRKIIDSRSPAADALLDYREPPRTERSDRLAKLEAEIARLQLQIERLSDPSADPHLICTGHLVHDDHVYCPVHDGPQSREAGR